MCVGVGEVVVGVGGVVVVQDVGVDQRRGVVHRVVVLLDGVGGDLVLGELLLPVLAGLTLKELVEHAHHLEPVLAAALVVGVEALVVDGDIVAAAQEERFSRKKHDDRFPGHAVAECRKEGGIRLEELDDGVG